MPSAINANGATLRIEPLPKDAGKKTNFGVVIHDLDLSNIGGMTLVQNQQSPLADQTEADTDVDALKKAIWENKVVIVKGQKDLPPIKQWELVTRFDPDAPKVHSHGSLKTFNKQGGILSASRDVIGMPGAENVRLIGKGYQGADHYGIKDKTVKKPLSHDWHVTELPAEEFESGHTRFQRWHLDAPLYERDPAWFTTLRCIKRPTSPKVTVHWDDGSGQTLETEPGLTAFLSNVQTYDLMTPDEKAMADHSWVEYAPHPYQWMGNCRGNPNGLGVASQGYEKPLEELGEWNPKFVKRYPMVWVNPVTGEKAFMVHGICVRKLFLRSSEGEEPKVIDNVEEIRSWLKRIQERILRPEYIMLPEVEEGDIVMWANWQCFHTAIDYPDSFGPRTMHQANVSASSSPVGPVPITTCG